LPVLMLPHDVAKSPLTAALRDSLEREGVTAAQLARALSDHVFELEKATFVNTGTPFESIVRSPGASTFYDATIPCADQPHKPLTLRIERTTQQMGTLSKFAGFAPWLIEEAKKQSKEPLDAAAKGKEANDEAADQASKTDLEAKAPAQTPTHVHDYKTPEVPYPVKRYGFSGAIWPQIMVLSTKQDMTPFLKEEFFTAALAEPPAKK